MTPNTVAPEGRRLVFRGLLIGGILAALLVIILRNGRSSGEWPSSGVAMVFLGVTNLGGSNHARFDVTNHPGHVSFHFARIETPTTAGWNVVASNVPVRSAPPGIALPLSTTNERVRIVFHVGTGSVPPFEWMHWFWLNRPLDDEFLTNEVTLPPIPSTGER